MRQSNLELLLKATQLPTGVVRAFPEPCNMLKTPCVPIMARQNALMGNAFPTSSRQRQFQLKCCDAVYSTVASSLFARIGSLSLIRVAVGTSMHDLPMPGQIDLNTREKHSAGSRFRTSNNEHEPSPQYVESKASRDLGKCLETVTILEHRDLPHPFLFDCSLTDVTSDLYSDRSTAYAAGHMYPEQWSPRVFFEPIRYSHC